MKGNFHVRFLEGGGLATARFHSVKSHLLQPIKFRKSRILHFADRHRLQFAPPYRGLRQITGAVIGQNRQLPTHLSPISGGTT